MVGKPRKGLQAMSGGNTMHGWLQAIHADSLIRVRLFHPDHFENIAWESGEIGLAGRGAVNERTIINTRRKHVSTNHERIMIELENHDRR
eukprot:4936697-Amphidinium_carterae.1